MIAAQCAFGGYHTQWHFAFNQTWLVIIVTPETTSIFLIKRGCKTCKVWLSCLWATTVLSTELKLVTVNHWKRDNGVWRVPWPGHSPNFKPIIKVWAYGESFSPWLWRLRSWRKMLSVSGIIFPSFFPKFVSVDAFASWTVSPKHEYPTKNKTSRN